MPGLDEYEICSFTPEGGATMILSSCLVGWSDHIAARLASFGYIKRDGAEVEPMGADQAKFLFKIALMGSAPLYEGGGPLSAKDRYRRLIETQRNNPRGQLAHPRLGKWQVALRDVYADESPQDAIDCINATLEFVEDQIDQALAIDSRPTPQALANRAVTAYTILLAASRTDFGANPNPLTQLADKLATDFATAVASFVALGLQAAQTVEVSAGVWVAVGRVSEKRVAYFKALDDTLAVSLLSPVSLVPYRDAAYTAEAACHELAVAIAAQRPSVVSYEVPTAQSMIELCLALYGRRAQDLRPEIERLNPHAPTIRLPAGYRLRVLAPVVRQ